MRLGRRYLAGVAGVAAAGAALIALVPGDIRGAVLWGVGTGLVLQAPLGWLALRSIGTDHFMASWVAGMLVRLAFSISTAVEPEVLLIDEVLGAGDLAFQIKARQRMREMMAAARLMVLVTHDIPTLEQICNRAVWLQHGAMMLDGKPDEVVAAYKASVNTPQAAPHVGGVPGNDAPAAAAESKAAA